MRLFAIYDMCNVAGFLCQPQRIQLGTHHAGHHAIRPAPGHPNCRAGPTRYTRSFRHCGSPAEKHLTMAIKSVIYKVQLQVADMDRHYYADHALNIACHPSETLQRMMTRVLVFALNAHERLEFGKGISDTDEPDLWQKDLTGAIERWIDVGQPDERRILKACGRAAGVQVYAYGSSADIWWKQIASKLTRTKNLTVWQIDADVSEQLERLCERTMQLQVTLQDGEVWVRNASDAVEIRIRRLMPAD